MKKLFLMFCLCFSTLSANQLLKDYTAIIACNCFQRVMLNSDSLYYLLTEKTENDSNNETRRKWKDKHLNTRSLMDLYDSIIFLSFWISLGCYYKMEEQGNIIRGTICYPSKYYTLYDYSRISAVLVSCVKIFHLLGIDIKDFWLRYKSSEGSVKDKGMING